MINIHVRAKKKRPAGQRGRMVAIGKGTRMESFFR